VSSPGSSRAEILGVVPDFFVYSRDAPGAARLREDRELLEAHWSYMDAFADTMIARGPTLTPDRETATGSLHVLGLPSVEAAHRFVAEEPNNRAGLYAEHVVYRFEHLLGRTMWEVSCTPGEPLFLVIARSGASAAERPIVHGRLSTLEDARPAGVALAVEARDLDAALTGLDGVEVHDWELGGRR
jgi:uncharacterized protein YciI